MAFPKPLRLQLGLSLAEFATLLDTNIGQLSMAESGLRDLPAASLEIAYGLEKALNRNTEQKANDDTLNAKTIALLTKQIRSVQLKLDALQMQEGKLKEKLRAARRMLSVSEASITTLSQPNNEDIHLQLAVLKRKASKKIITLEVEYMQLQLSIASHHAMLTKAKELAGS